MQTTNENKNCVRFVVQWSFSNYIRSALILFKLDLKDERCYEYACTQIYVYQEFLPKATLLLKLRHANVNLRLTFFFYTSIILQNH